jgi:hypothetical protein
MPPPATGIAPDVIRDVTPPSHLGGDLLDGTFRALPRPPPHADPKLAAGADTSLLMRSQYKSERFRGAEVEDAVDAATVHEVWRRGTLASAGAGLVNRGNGARRRPLLPAGRCRAAIGGRRASGRDDGDGCESFDKRSRPHVITPPPLAGLGRETDQDWGEGSVRPGHSVRPWHRPLPLPWSALSGPSPQGEGEKHPTL